MPEQKEAAAAESERIEAPHEQEAEEGRGAAAAPAAPAPTAAAGPGPGPAPETPTTTTTPTAATPDETILFLLLEKLRAAAREERVANRRALLREIKSPSAGGSSEWDVSCGVDDDGDDDGEGGGAVMGCGWRGCTGADRAFAQTLASASRVSRSWLGVALRAADRATFTPRDVGSPRAGRATTIAACSGGVLRALYVRAPPPAWKSWPRDQAHERVVVDEGRRLAQEQQEQQQQQQQQQQQPAAAETDADWVLRRLRVLKLDNPLLAALAGAPLLLSGRLASPALPALVHLEIGRARPSDLPPADFFSLANLPSLRVLSLSPLASHWQAPIELAPNDQAPLQLTRLRVRPAEWPPPQPSWPWAEEPLLISVRSLAALAPTLRSLDVKAVSSNEGKEDHGGGGGGGGGAGGGNDDNLATSDGPPLGRLVPCLSPLTQLTSLTLSSSYDFASCSWDAWESDAERLFGPLALARLEILTQGTYLDDAQEAGLPRSLSVLTRLTCLEVRFSEGQMAAHDCLRALADAGRLRRLEFEAGDYDEVGTQPSAAELAPFSRLEHLRIFGAGSDYANLFENQLPSLRSLVLSYDDTYDKRFGLPKKLLGALKRRIRAGKRSRGKRFHVKFGYGLGDTDPCPLSQMRMMEYEDEYEEDEDEMDADLGW